MQYLMLLYTNENSWHAMTESERNLAFAAYMEFNQTLVRAGAMVIGAQLTPAHTATTLRSTEGKLAMTDGPFAETKEQLGGIYLVECPTLDEALALAGQCPGVLHGAVALDEQIGLEPQPLEMTNAAGGTVVFVRVARVEHVVVVHELHVAGLHRHH